MDYFNFDRYDKNSELIGGDYWTFLDATAEDIVKDNIYLKNINKIIMAISNEELKVKMKKKIISLIIEKGISFCGLGNSLDIFSGSELKTLLKREFDIRVAKLMANEDDAIYRFDVIMSFIVWLQNVNDNEWEYSILSDILNKIKDYKNCSFFINIVDYYRYNKEIYNKLITDYYNYFPETYKNLLRMRQDPNYIYNKSLTFMNEGIDIGIDPRISIVPEIEVNIDFDYRLDLTTQKGFDEYNVGRDATVHNGSEITPVFPFHNVQGDVAKFCALCEAIKDIGYYYNESSPNAAGQINLGLDYLDTKEAILNFYEIYGNCEELLYYICNEEGQLFRQDVYTNSRIKAISAIIGRRNLDEELSRQDVIKMFNSSLGDNSNVIQGLQYKKNSVCLRGSTDEDYRLEFRIPNGGCNYRTWIDNIRLFGKMLEISKKLADMMKKDYLTDEEERLLKLKIDLQGNDLTFEEKLNILMDLLFDDNNIKKIYQNRYQSTLRKIKETHSNKYQNQGAGGPSFDEVEFIEQYHSMFEPDYDGSGLIITYDPESDEIVSNKKKR